MTYDAQAEAVKVVTANRNGNDEFQMPNGAESTAVINPLFATSKRAGVHRYSPIFTPIHRYSPQIKKRVLAYGHHAGWKGEMGHRGTEAQRGRIFRPRTWEIRHWHVTRFHMNSKHFEKLHRRVGRSQGARLLARCWVSRAVRLRQALSDPRKK